MPPSARTTTCWSSPSTSADPAAPLPRSGRLSTRFGRLDVLVNNAGNFNAGFFEELSPEEFRAQIETTLFGPVNVTRAALPVMRAQRSGLIVTISSTAGIVGGEFLTAYAASKFGVEGWLESLTPEIAPFGIRTMLVEPGFFRTELLTPESTMDALHDVVRAGKARYLGASSMWAWQFPAVNHPVLVLHRDEPRPTVHAGDVRSPRRPGRRQHPVEPVSSTGVIHTEESSLIMASWNKEVLRAIAESDDLYVPRSARTGPPTAHPPGSGHLSSMARSTSAPPTGNSPAGTKPPSARKRGGSTSAAKTTR